MFKFVKNISIFIFNYLLPPTCLNCGQVVSQSRGLCHDCYSKINFIEGSICEICGAPFELEEESGAVCGKCLEKRKKYDKARAMVLYDENSKNMILNFKYKDRTDASPYFANWLVKAGGDYFKTEEKPDYLIAVPLHKFRFIKRKFNQSALLAKSVSKKTKTPILYDCLIRTKNTKPQAGLRKKQRSENIKGAFKVKNKKQIKNKKILIIDDVMTTGATLQECANILKKAGAKKVFVLTIARTKD